MTGPGQLHLRPGPSLREALAGAVAEMVGRAERMSRLARTRPAYAVHEWRKAMRRARAVVRLCEGGLAEEHERSISGAFRRAQRAASGLRDADVLLPALRELANQKGAGPAERAALDRVKRRLHRSPRAVGRPDRRGQMAARRLARHLGPIRTASARFHRALPLELGAGELESGLAASYRRAVKRLRRSRKGGEEAFHELRKSVKVLHYQCELFADTGGRAASKLRKRLSALAEAQGRVTDLMLVRAELSPAESEVLHDLLERAIERRRKPADRKARKLLEERPRRFARSVVALP